MAVVIAGGTTLPATPQEVFPVLADLDQHRLLIDDGMRILRLDGPAGRRSGGVVELRGPLGLRRRARTRVRGAEFPTSMWGTAETPNGSCAALRWQLRPHPAGTRVRLELDVTPRGTDQLLLTFGGRLWLRRRLRVSLRRLHSAVRPVVPEESVVL